MAERLDGKEKVELGSVIVVFIGPEGSGKTTQAQKLAEATGKPYATTSGLLHDLAENDSGPLGDECRAMFNEHRYLDGETLLKILAHQFRRPFYACGLILDGGMRTVEETAGFAAMLDAAGINLPLVVVHLRIPVWMSVARLLARGRNDDTTAGIQSRLDKYHFRLTERVKIIEAQEGWGLIHVDGMGSEDEVFGLVIDKLTLGG